MTTVRTSFAIAAAVFALTAAAPANAGSWGWGAKEDCESNVSISYHRSAPPALIGRAAAPAQPLIRRVAVPAPVAAPAAPLRSFAAEPAAPAPRMAALAPVAEIVAAPAAPAPAPVAETAPALDVADAAAAPSEQAVTFGGLTEAERRAVIIAKEGAYTPPPAPTPVAEPVEIAELEELSCWELLLTDPSQVFLRDNPQCANQPRAFREMDSDDPITTVDYGPKPDYDDKDGAGRDGGAGGDGGDSCGACP